MASAFRSAKLSSVQKERPLSLPHTFLTLGDFVFSCLLEEVTLTLLVTLNDPLKLPGSGFVKFSLVSRLKIETTALNGVISWTCVQLAVLCK